jgi:chromosome segregation ATPase
MTENDEGAVRRYALGSHGGIPTMWVREGGPYILHEDHERIVTALRSQLAAAESKALAVHEVLGRDLEVLRGRLAAADGRRDQLMADLASAQNEAEGLPSQSAFDQVKSERDGARAGLIELQERESKVSQGLAKMIAKEQELMARTFRAEGERDQALARLGEAEKMLTRIRDGHEEQIHGSILEDLDSFLARDSAGGMK